MLTGLFHTIALLLFFSYALLAEYDYPDEAHSFRERVSSCHNALVFLSCLAVLPIGFVLKRPEMKSLSPVADDNAKSPGGKRNGRKPKPESPPADQA